jgi:tetratricopeptide (TPR) repeat protein
MSGTGAAFCFSVVSRSERAFFKADPLRQYHPRRLIRASIPVNLRVFRLPDISRRNIRMQIPARHPGNAGRGRNLFTKKATWLDSSSSLNKAPSMTVTVSATSLPDADGARSFPALQLRIGQEYYSAGAIDEAIAAYRQGLAAVASEAADCVPVEIVSELNAKLGNACMVRGDLESAASSYIAALRLAPHLTACWCNLGNVHVKLGKPHDAIALYGQALALDPGHWPSRTNLVQALMGMQQYVMAKALLTELADERPQDAQLRNQLGKVHFELNELEPAMGFFRQAVSLNPSDSDSMYWIGGIQQRLGETDAAETAYAEAARIQPLIRRPAAKFPADFRVLALYAPFAGNMPTGYLFKDAAYDSDTLAVFASNEYDVETLKQDVQVLVNLISDADQADGLLPLAADLVTRFGKPTVNDPARILRTTRDAVADLLAGIAGCRIPKVLRQKAGTDLCLDGPDALAAPMLARPVGTHGGDDFEKIETEVELARFLAQRPDTDRYLIEYIDYRSVDGYFRKYRFIFVDDQILPYHLAISDDWKIHHDSTDMIDHQWMQTEEEAFLSNPAGAFNPGHYQALREIQQRIGLEYFGIDCGLDRSGNLVVFEVNASMLVHEHNEGFPYKDPFVLRIKTAFDEMLRKLANVAAAGESRV